MTKGVSARDVERARTLLRLLTIRQIIQAGDRAIEASGLNPWVMAEGLASGDESYEPLFLDQPPAPPPEGTTGD